MIKPSQKSIQLIKHKSPYSSLFENTNFITLIWYKKCSTLKTANRWNIPSVEFASGACALRRDLYNPSHDFDRHLSSRNTSRIDGTFSSDGLRNAAPRSDGRLGGCDRSIPTYETLHDVSDRRRIFENHRRSVPIPKRIGAREKPNEVYFENVGVMIRLLFCLGGRKRSHSDVEYCNYYW